MQIFVTITSLHAVRKTSLDGYVIGEMFYQNISNTVQSLK